MGGRANEISMDEETIKLVVTKQELSTLHNAVNLISVKGGQSVPRTFLKSQLPIITEIIRATDEFIDEFGQIAEKGVFELNLKPASWALIAACLDDRDWFAGNAESVLSLKEKLPQKEKPS